MYCTKCGTKNDDDSRFCTNCGTGLQNIDIYTTDKKAVNKDIRAQRFGKINSKNIGKDRNVLVIAILGIAIIISVALIFFSNNHDTSTYDDVEDPTVIQDTDNTIVISDEQGQDTLNKETVEVSISSIPQGANIYINNRSKGKTPIKINLSEGDYSLKTDLIGYKNVSSNFNVTLKSGYDTNATIDITLDPINESIESIES